jgi:putative restriction endonuclease
MKIYVGVTDKDWFQFLGRLKLRREVAGEALEEANFWQPGGKQLFKALQPGDLFLFKLHSPDNFIVGGGFFGHASLLPAALAWETFGQMNGTVSFEDMQMRIVKYRAAAARKPPFTIGCILLQNPFFLEPARWIPAPADFHLNIVQGKGYDDSSSEMRRVLSALGSRASPGVRPTTLADADGPMFGAQTLARQRLGQGTFRVLVTDTYERRCAITRERTLPTLEAAHILPVGEGGRHRVDNGLLLRSDVHRLFDAGYVTITPDHRFRVSKKIREEFDNGKEYYAMDGRPLWLPSDTARQPNRDFLSWHSETRFMG